MRSFSLCILLLSISADLLLAQPPTVTLSLRYTQSYDSTFDSLGTPLFDPIGPNNQVATTDYHEFAVDMQVFGLSSAFREQDFHRTVFDVVRGPFVQPVDFSEFGLPGSWIPTQIYWDVPGTPPPDITWHINEDAGTSPLDLEEIVVDSVFPSRALQTLQPGERIAVEVGRFYVRIEGMQEESYVSLAPDGASPWSIWEAGMSVPQPASTFHVGAPFIIRVVPEPSTFILFGSALVWWTSLIRRRRTD